MSLQPCMSAQDAKVKREIRPSDMTDMRHEIIMQHRDILHETLSWLNADFPICTSRANPSSLV